MFKTLQNILPYQDYLRRLHAVGIPHPTEDIEIIVGMVLGLNGAILHSNPPQSISPDDQLRIETAITAREKRMPIERIFDVISFSGLDLHVHPHVHKPYPETEDAVLQSLLLFSDRQRALRILDLGTGSGCILLSLLKAFPHATGLGTDIDPQAIAAAQANADRNSLTDRAEFRINNWSDGITEHFDLVISNPPRVATSDMKYLPPEMGRYDPPAALNGGEDGLKFFHLLAQDFTSLVKPGGYGCTQIGQRYVDAALEIFYQAGLRHLSLKACPLGQPSLIIYEHKAEKNWRQKITSWLTRQT